MKNHRIISVKVLQMTNTMNARIKLTEDRFNKKDSKTIGFFGSDIIAEAIEYLQSKKINVVGYGLFKDDYIIFSDSWGDSDGFKSIV